MRSFFIAALAVLLAAATSWSLELTVTPDHPTGVYQPGEKVVWKIEVKGGTAETADFVIKKGGLTEVAKGKQALVGGVGQIEATLGEPGALLADVSVPGADDKGKPVKALGGAVFAPEKIAVSAARPDDFDAFWQTKLDELAKVPVNAVLEAGDSGKPNVDYWKISMDNIRGSHIRGQIARPKGEGKLPAMLIVQWAGVYPLQKGWVTDRAAEGWLALNILAHDLPIDQPADFYKQQDAGPLKGYPSIGNDDRETSYFLRMYLSCYRAAEYLATRPDWDGRVLVVTGGSQGGLQSFVTAALHPKITAVLAAVPAGCDMLGPDAGRDPGWPKWYWQVKDKDAAKVRQASRYFDVVNFAPRIRCPVLVGLGLIDTTCPPSGVFAACNQLQGPKELVILVDAGHQNQKNNHAPYYTRFGAWSNALRKGEPAPVK